MARPQPRRRRDGASALARLLGAPHSREPTHAGKRTVRPTYKMLPLREVFHTGEYSGIFLYYGTNSRDGFSSWCAKYFQDIAGVTINFNARDILRTRIWGAPINHPIRERKCDNNDIVFVLN